MLCNVNVFDIMVHAGEKPLECIQGYKYFSIRCTLKMHLRRHTGWNLLLVSSVMIFLNILENTYT